MGVRIPDPCQLNHGHPLLCAAVHEPNLSGCASGQGQPPGLSGLQFAGTLLCVAVPKGSQWTLVVDTVPPVLRTMDIYQTTHVDIMPILDEIRREKVLIPR
jgi:hypothetical protein